ncbi:MAG: phosphatidylserine decarboxylase, partial [Desulfomonilaceae bacterium]
MNLRTGHYEPISREGLFIVGLFGILAILAWWFHCQWTCLLFLMITAAIASFFRNPERKSPTDKESIVSPADGTVMEISENAESPIIGERDLTRVSVFMSIFNVHVNRWPYSGIVEKIKHRPGKFLDARDPSSSMVNENNAIVVQTDFGALEIVQIAGKIARRIVWWVKEGDKTTKGD